LNVAVTVTLFVRSWRVQDVPALILQPAHPPNVPFGTAVKVTLEPVGKLPVQDVPGVAAHPRPDGELDIVPLPVPAKSTVTVGPVPLKHTTLAVMEPVTTAPDELKPPSLVFVVAVAETSVAPHKSPVAVSRPAEVTVNIWTVFDSQVTWFVMSLVTGG
jgi:hypothetical protein